MHKQRRFGGLVAAMEELDEAQIAQIATAPAEVNSTEQTVDPEAGEPTSSVTEVVEVQFPEGSESPEAAEVEVAEAEAEVSDTEDQIEDAVQTADRIEEVKDIVERSAENGGLDKNGAELLNATLEGLYDRIGLKLRGRAIPSLENFGTTTSRIRSTHVSVEEISSKLKSIWERIVKALTAFYEQIQQFMTQIFTQLGRFKERSKKLRDAATNLQGPAQTSQITDARVVSSLAIGRMIPDTLPASIGEVSKFVVAQNQYSTQLVNTYGAQLTKITTDLNSKEGVVASEVTKLQSDLDGFFKSGATASVLPESNAEGARASKVMLGNKQFVASVSADSTSVSLNTQEGVATNDIAKVLTKDQAVQVLNAVDGLITQIESVQKTQATVNTFQTNFGKAVRNVRFATNDESSLKDKAIPDFVRKLPQLNSFIARLPSLTAGYARGVVGASLTYVEKSLRAYQKAEQEAAAPAAAGTPALKAA